jgi:hypothetical protein
VKIASTFVFEEALDGLKKRFNFSNLLAWWRPGIEIAFSKGKIERRITEW